MMRADGGQRSLCRLLLVGLTSFLLLLFTSGQAEQSYQETRVKVYRESLQSQETVPVRYYDAQPHVAYMDIQLFYQTFMRNGTQGLEGMRVEQNGNAYILTVDDGTTAIVDSEKDIMTLDHLPRFTVLPYYKQQTDGVNWDPETPFLRYVKSIETLPLASMSVLRFCDYAIDIIGDGDALYFPVATLSNLFCDQNCYCVFFNGSAFYVTDMSGTLQSKNAKDAVSGYTSGILRGKERAEDLRNFTYHELCFLIDTFYGLPGSEMIHDDLSQKGLDQTLTDQYPAVKELLLSENWTEYIVGLRLLFQDLLDDGGHTRLSISTDSRAASMYQQWHDQLFPGRVSLRETYFKEAAPIAAYRQAFYQGRNYVETGDIAVLRMDRFELDTKGWRAYYVRQGAMPESDSLGLVYHALMRAQENTDIRYFVLDVSANSGGDERALLGVLGLLTNDCYLYAYDRVTGQYIRSVYRMDRNLDGFFDARDDAVDYPFQIMILTSKQSYSCANLLPAILHDQGMMIVGQRAGGGACPIQKAMLADGLEIQIASRQCMVYASGKSVDDGQPVDVLLVQESRKQEKDYSHFYDMALWRQYLMTSAEE